MTTPLTGDQAAALAGLTARRLRQLGQEGIGPEQSADGRYPPDKFAVWLRERWKADLGVTEDGEVYDYATERARLTKAQADKTELEVAELNGELIRAGEVTTGWSTKFAAMRARLLSLPSKLAPRVARPGAVAEAEELAREIIYEALHELAGDGLPERARERLARRRERDFPAAAADGQRVGGSESAVEPGVKRRTRKVADKQG